MNTSKTFAILALAAALSAPHHPAPSAEAADARTSWCGPTQEVDVSFRLKKSGKTVSICRDGKALVYAFGMLGGEPELEYRGPVLGHSRFFATLWSPRNGDDDHGLARAARIANEEPRDAELSRRLARAAEARDTEGFHLVYFLTGIVSQVVYVFRTGGWEYAVVISSGRPIVLGAEAKDYETREITLVSPEGKPYLLEGVVP